MTDQRLTQEHIRETNRHIIFTHIYNKREVLQQNIINDLKLSRPTIIKHLTVMRKEELLLRRRLPLEPNTPGRAPVMLSVNAKHKIALGVEILKDSVKIIAIDLYGKALRWEKLFMDYENTDTYYQEICENVKQFITRLKLPKVGSKILGVGFALQGLVSEDGSTVIYGEILKCTGLKIDVFTKYLPYPCMFVHEPDSAALSELFVSPELQDAVYLSMSEHLGGAFIFGRKILNGIHRHSATFEHITARKDGEPCYCGKRGCFETICSKVALLRGEEPEDFFPRVRNGDTEAVERWGVFLEYLGRLIAHLHLVVDTKYILGGHLAPYFTQEDVDVLYKYVRERTPFIEEDDYILRSRIRNHNITIGAALPYVMSFLEKV